MKKLIIALFVINTCSFIHAEPTNPSIQKVTQPNGDTISISFRGDEYGNSILSYLSIRKN